MTISFKCSCGNPISVPDESAGREAFCPACRKRMPVPAASLELTPSTAPDRREASEFRPGALAQLLGNDAPAGGAAASPARPASPQAASRSPAQSAPQAASNEAPRPAPAGSPPAGQSATPRKPRVEVLPDKVKFHCECGQKVSVRRPAPKTAGKCPRCGRSLRVPDVDEGSRAPAAAQKEGAPQREKINCLKCGRRIEDLTAAFCPRCGFPLALRPPVATPDAASPAAASPAPSAPPPPSTPPAPATAAPESARPPSEELRRRNAREAAEAAADLLRAAPASRPAGDGPAPAGLVRRLAAFLVDALAAAAVGLLAVKLGTGVGSGTGLAAPTAATIGASAFLLLNEVLFAGCSGARSLGMLICGVAVYGSSGRTAGPLLLGARTGAFLLLFIGAPLALFEARRRTLHDLICGTTVRRANGG